MSTSYDAFNAADLKFVVAKMHEELQAGSVETLTMACLVNEV